MTRFGTDPQGDKVRCDRCGIVADCVLHTTTPGTILGPPRSGQWSDGHPLHRGWLSVVNVFDGPHYCPNCAPVAVRHQDEAIRAFIATINLY